MATQLSTNIEQHAGTAVHTGIFNAGAMHPAVAANLRTRKNEMTALITAAQNGTIDAAGMEKIATQPTLVGAVTGHEMHKSQTTTQTRDQEYGITA